MTKLLYDFIICSMATFFFAILFRTPKKAVFSVTVMGGLGYVAYDLCRRAFSVTVGYFVGTLLISVCAEILARRRKMPALVFITPAVIPLVPGAGLYHTMRLFVYGETMAGLEKCIETLSCAGVMAVAIALAPMMIRVLKIK